MGQAFAIDVAESAAGSAAGNLCNLCLINPIFNRVTVLRNCNKNVADLKKGVEDLELEQQRVENCKKDADRKGKVIEDIVPTWLQKAEELIKVAKELVVEGEKIADRECFFSLCPHPLSRYELSKKAEKNLKGIDELVQKARGFHLRLSQAPSLQHNMAAVVEGFEQFPSRMAILEQIMEALRSPTVNKVGVYGISGVGKTMLVKMVKGYAKQDSLFPVVVMATVTKGRDLKSIQEDIARDLGMDQLPVGERTDRQVADLIRDKLINVKKFLVILDDVWETEIDFEKLGIPSASQLEKTNKGSSSGQEDMLCKVLITSRYRDVLSGMMDEKDRLFEVRELKDDEACQLFKKIVGSNVESSDFQPIAKEIVEKCLGLPVAIASVGKAMKGKSQQHQWVTALVDLRKPTPEGIAAGVYKPIELSYKYLQGEELKQTFMLCSLLGHDSSINDLLKYGMGLNLFRNVKTTEETRAKVLTLVLSLKQSSLLVDGHSNMHFGMHDQIREIALSIAAREHGVLALVDEDVGKEWPEEETMEKLKWIYLSNGYPAELTSNGLKCPRLTFFHLSNKGCSLAAPTDLFTGTKGLRVLCLTKIDFQSIHSQIPLIPTKLHTLLLDRCVFRVKELGSIVANLESLEVLSLAGCDIEELPREIEKLSKLKLLDVSDCTELKVVPPQLLTRLSQLEELNMGNSFDRWDDVEGGNASLAELTELHELTALEVRISNFQDTFFPNKLERFKIFIGIVKRHRFGMHRRWYPRRSYCWNSDSWESSFESSKMMKVKLQGASIKSNDSIKKLLKKTEELYLEGLNGVENLVYELNDEGFQHLKCLHVQDAPDITHIFNLAGSLVPSHVFPVLEVLTLLELEKMKKISDGLTGAATFKKLRKITVVGCHQLKNLFSYSMGRQLQLEEIIVERCANIEQIIDDVEEQGNGNDIVEESEGCKLGNTLRSLKLEALPKLTGFNSNCSDISLFNDKVVFPNLEELQLFSIKINQLCVKNPQGTLNLERLKSLQVSNCSSLEYLLTLSMVSGLGQLQSLSVSRCQDLKQVIMVKEVEVAVNTELIIPQLKFISLEYCDKLSSFYAGSNTLRFPLLEEITVMYCRKMVRFASKFSSIRENETTAGKSEETLIKEEPDILTGPFFCDKVVFPNLEKLQLYWIKIDQLCVENLPETLNFKRLKRLQVHNCSSLEYLWTLSMVSGLGQLQDLNVLACEDLKQVIMTEGVEEAVNTELIFPQLQFISLVSCFKLSSFYAGSNTLRFPLLEKITVVKCRKMVRFASKFSSIRGKETTAGKSEETLIKEELWPFFCDEIVFPNLEKLELWEIKVNQLWTTSSYVENPQEILNFKGLKHLEIFYCSTLEYLFTPSMVSGLGQLKNLRVRDCNGLKQVIMAEGVEEAVTREFIFPRLNFILLENCKNLSSFYAGSGSYALKFQSAINITIWNCPNMITFVSTFSSEKEKETAYEKTDQGHLQKNEPNICSQTLFDDMVVIPLLDDLSLVSICAQQIWHSQITPMSSFVQKLRKLTLWHCNNLKYLFTSLLVKIFEQLEVLQIWGCEEMQVVILIEEPIENERKSQTMFPKPNSTEQHDFAKSGNTDVKYGIMFSQLKSLELKNLPKLSSYSTGKCDLEFPSLKEVIVIECPQMKYFSMGKTVAKGLQTVQWKQDDKKGHWVGDLNSTIQDLFTQKVAYLDFRNTLWLSKFPELIEIWKMNPEKLSSLSQNLQHLKVCNCNNLSYLLTPNMALALVQLEDLEIKDCAAMEQVIMVTGFEEVVETGLTFPQLKSILLESCSKLSSFYVGSNALRFPLLENITVKNCPKMVRFTSKFSSIQENETTNEKSEEMLVKEEPNIFIGPFFCDMVEFSKLKLLKLTSINIYQIWHNQISENPSSIQNLKELEELVVEGCGNLKHLLTSSMIKSFEKLTQLQICDCKMMEIVILTKEAGEEERMSENFFPKLYYLKLEELPILTRFCFGNFLEFSSLANLQISKCPMLKTFISSSIIGDPANVVNADAPYLFDEKVKFPKLNLLKLTSINSHQIWHNQMSENSSSIQKLIELVVKGCGNLKYLLTSSMIKSFKQLTKLQICDCKMMEIVIFTKELGEEETMSEIFLPRLHYLKLKELPILTRFCSGNFLEFSSLIDFQISKCPMLKTFISSSIIADTENGVNTYTPSLFDEKVKIPMWTTLTLSSINIRQIWNSQLSSISPFAQHLTKLKVVNCCNLKYLLTFSMVKSFAQLEELMISECEIMEVVILIEGMTKEERIYRSMFPQLKTLVLNDLPQLATFCSNCDSLGEISKSKRVNLGIGSQELLAMESTSMETKATKIVFSPVTWLALRLLPKFKYFFPQTHITEWPLLECLVVMECHEVQIVASKFSSIEMTRGDNQLERESQPLMFWISKATFPSLKHLAVKWNDNLKIWCGHHTEEYFGLEVLTLIGFPKQSAFPPPFFFESLPNLKQLVVKDAFLSEIFQCEEVTAKEKPVYGHTSLSKLTLSKLHELTHLWKEESQLEADILNNLRSLKVQECGRLKNLVPSTVHFDNLQTLVVSECHGLVNLMRYSTAKSLGQLDKMKVANCEMIEEIVICLGDDVKDDGIVFTKLWFLQLKGLPRLESFCSGNCNFKFPALHQAIVTECPNMQTFSQGELSTPRLHEVKLTGDIYGDMDKDIEKKIDDIFHEDEEDEIKDESCWEGNLNSTIQHLFEEKSARSSKKSNGENSDHDIKEDGN